MDRSPYSKKVSRRTFIQTTLMAPGLLAILQNRPTPSRAVRFLNYDEAEPVIRSGKFSLPAALSSQGGRISGAAWSQWLRTRDSEIRNRLQRGEEDTLANFVLLGVSFTNAPRLTSDITDPDEIDRRLRLRVDAFVSAVAAPSGNERLVLLSDLIRRLGHSAVRGEARERLSDYVLDNIHRYLAERQRYQSTIDALAAREANITSADTSTLYRDRGISVDTDFRPDYAIEAALTEARRRNLLSSVRRVAIVGPGLDFTDKDSGFDYYPLQTLQPFAVIDSLLRLGLASVRNLQVSLLEISKPTLDHVSRAVANARARRSYTLQLVLDQTRPWNPGALDYWQRLGTAIGTSVDPLPLPSQVQGMRRRAVRVRPEIVQLLDPVSMNVVLQRAALPQTERFDLVVATNIFVYYDSFEQALGLSNIESMLAPSGVFLSNDLSREYAGVRLRPVGLARVSYDRNQEDQVQIYSRSAFQPQFPPA